MPHEVPVDGVLDLHAFTPRDVTAVVREYLRAAALAGLTDVRLIHGRGTGYQRAAVQAVLASHPAVDTFCDAPECHLGATVSEAEADEGSARYAANRRAPVI